MPYTKHDWSNNEAVTSSKLNAIEDGIKEINMAYEKNTWARGDVVTAAKLNHMEDGIAGGGGGDSDFSTAQVTVQGDGASEILIIGCFACHVPDAPYEDMMMTFGRFGEALVLYKGVSYIQIDNPQQKTISVSGNIEEVTDGEYFVTGDCTITVNE